MFSRLFYALATFAILGGGLFAYLQPASSQVTSLNPVATAVTSTGAGVVLVTANPTRHSIQFCNTGATNGVWIWPGPLTPVVSFYEIPPVASNLTACYTIPIGASNFVSNQWNASGISTVGIAEY